MRDSNAHFPNLAIALALLLLLASCSSDTSTSSLGEAYVAPASLNLHSGLTSKSSTVAVLKHGDRLTVLDVKRRYVKVSTGKGVEGWLDSRQLLSRDQMLELRRETEAELRLKSQGHATTFDVLNIHIDPERRSPAFAQIPAGAPVELLAHKAVVKASGNEPLATPSFIRTPIAPTAPRRSKRQKPQKALSLRPPMPPAPKPPANWQALSSERIGPPTEAQIEKEQREAEAAKKNAVPVKPPVLEDWSLIRTKDGKVGWVLARNLYMSIPDEVAQYAEGQRISSYFDLGVVQDDEKGPKHHWLWTTSSQAQAFDFDRFRVFYWNRRRHRYETSYRQRDLVGYFPVEVESAPGDAPRHFSLIVQDTDGKYFKKTFLFDGTRVHLASSEAYEPQSTGGPTKAAALEVEKMEAKKPAPGWVRRQFDKLRHMFQKTPAPAAAH